ncbi:MAG: DUF1565 domain-containing protein [Desertifilum sp. SIO1I2]|nr:DUF1565 domain-containing protein [Desertifilum sp. SIO1I2]
MRVYQGSQNRWQTSPTLIKSVRVGLSALVLFSSMSAVLPALAQFPSPTLTAQIPAGARVVYVNPSRGSDTSNAGTSDQIPYRTITYALQQASENTVIQLAPGSYTAETGEVFPLNLKPGVILRGSESNKGQTTVIIGSGVFISPTFARQNVTILAAKDSEISGVTVTNPSKRGTGVWVESTNPRIKDSTFTNNNREGVFVTGTGNPRIENNVFTQNLGNGVSVARSSSGSIRGNVFDNTGFGLTIGGTSTPTLSNNRIVNNTDGIVVTDTAEPILRENEIENNSRDGVIAITNANPNLGTADSQGRNIIRNNGRYDVYNATRSNVIAAAGNDIDSRKIQGQVDFTATTVARGQLRDIQGHWAETYIRALVAQDVIAGFPDGTFRPNEPVTRAQFATIVSKALSPAAKRGGTSFRDVPTNHWASAAIQSAYRGEFLTGFEDATFRPDLRIPRVQVLVSLVSGLGLRSLDTSVLSAYNDAAQIPSWATSAIAGATRSGLVINYPQPRQLNPNQQATRGEVAAFVYQALVNAGRAEPIESPYLVVNP